MSDEEEQLPPGWKKRLSRSTGTFSFPENMTPLGISSLSACLLEAARGVVNF